MESTNINVVSSAIGVSVVLMNIFLADTFQTIIFDMRKLMVIKKEIKWISSLANATNGHQFNCMKSVYIPVKCFGFLKKSDGKVGHFNIFGSPFSHSCAII